MGSDVGWDAAMHDGGTWDDAVLLLRSDVRVSSTGA